MNTGILFVLTWLVAASTALPIVPALGWDEAVRDADLIARVKVVSVAVAPADSGYKQLAHATITDAGKGPQTGESIDLLSDNGFICPNVLYKVGDDCIVFAQRRKSGYFETMNAYAGKLLLENGSAPFFPLRRRVGPPLLRDGTREAIKADMDRKFTAEEILAEVRRSLPAPPRVP